jgi:hypothetical protein
MQLDAERLEAIIPHARWLSDDLGPVFTMGMKYSTVIL